MARGKMPVKPGQRPERHSQDPEEEHVGDHQKAGITAAAQHALGEPEPASDNTTGPARMFISS